MSILAPKRPKARPVSLSPIIPPLESGDRLTRSEFERRYEAMPDLKKAELVEGVVYLASPVRSDMHATPHADLISWIGAYRVATPGVIASDNATVGVDLDNEFQPDVLLRIAASCGGQAQLNSRGYIEGAPELVAEVAATSAGIDLNAKFHVYRRNKVREYIVWRTLDCQLDWFILRDGEFQQLEPDSDGVLRSEVFPGLWLDAAALLSTDLSKVHKRLHEGLATAEHSAFVKKLARSKNDGLVGRPSDATPASNAAEIDKALPKKMTRDRQSKSKTKRTS